MSDDDIRSKHGTRLECIVGVRWWGWLRVGGENQECSALSFPMRAGSKRIANAFIKTDNRKSNVCWIKENKRDGSY